MGSLYLADEYIGMTNCFWLKWMKQRFWINEWWEASAFGAATSCLFSGLLLLWPASALSCLPLSLPPSLPRSLTRSLARSLSLSLSLSLALSLSLSLARSRSRSLSLSISLSLYYLLCSFCNPILLFAQPAQCVLQLPAAISQSTRVAHSARVVHST